MIELFVKGQSLTLSTPVVAADSLRYLEAWVHFTDGSWNGLSKWLHFKRGETVLDLLLDKCGRITEDDRLNLTAGEWTVYLTGVGEDTRATTVPVILTVKESGLVDAPLHEIPMSVAEQLTYLVGLALDRIKSIQYRAGLIILGFEPTLDKLREDKPNPAPGDAYAVGTGAPYNVWIWDGEGEKWVNAGPLVQSVAQGPRGVTFTPTVDEAGNISWVNDGERENPETVNIMGKPGETGARGPEGKSAYESAAEAGYTGDEEVFLEALAMLPGHAARHLPDGADPITVRTGNLADKAVTGDKIADNAVSALYTFEIGTEWVGETAPYTMEVSVEGLQGTDKVILDLIPSENQETAEAQMEAWSLIYRAKAEDGKLTLYASGRTTTGIRVQAMAVKK